MTNGNNNSSLIECTLLDALNYRPLAPRLTRKRLQLRKYYHLFLFQLFFKGAPLLMLIVLPFFENQHSFSSSSDYKGKEENSGDNKSYFWTSIVLEVVFLSIVTTDAFLNCLMLFPRRSDDRKIEDLCCKLDYYAAYFRLNIAYIITLLITWPLLFSSIGMYAKNGYTDQLIYVTFFRQLVRPMFLIAQVELIRKVIKAIFFTFLQLFSVNILLIIIIFLFAMIGLLIFLHHTNYSNNETNSTMITFDIDEGNEYFSSLSQAYWNMLVYLITASSHDIVTPAYKHHRAYFLYFATYFVITNYFLLKVIIALYTARFMSFLNDSMKRSYKNRLTNLSVAFALISKKRFTESAEITSEDVFGTDTKIQTDDMEMYHENIKLVLDDQEFNNICKTSANQQLNWKGFKDWLLKIFEYPQSSSDSLCKLEDILLARLIGTGNKSDFCCYGSYFIMQLYVAFTSLPLAIVHTITLTVLIVKDFDNSLTNPNSAMTTALLTFSFIFIPEFIARNWLIIVAYIFGRKQMCNKESCVSFKDWFLKGHRNRFSSELKHCFSIIVYIVDLLMLFTIIILGFVHVPCLHGQCLSGSNLFQLLQVNNILVLLRLLRMTTTNVLFARVIHTLFHVLVLLTPFILLGYLLYYEFAVLGMTIFHNSNFTDADAMTICGSYENLYYYPYTFEDFPSSLLTLWNLMIVNNWHIIVDAYVRGTTPAATVYFVIWWLIMETVFKGVLYGVLIEITITATKKFFKISKNLKKPSTISEKIKIALQYYCTFNIDDSPFNYSLINAWTIQGLEMFNIEEEDKKEINNEVIEEAVKNPDLLAKLRTNRVPEVNADVV